MQARYASPHTPLARDLASMLARDLASIMPASPGIDSGRGLIRPALLLAGGYARGQYSSTTGAVGDRGRGRAQRDR